MKLLAVHQEALTLHRVERVQQRQLDLAVELRHVLPVKLRGGFDRLLVQRGGAFRRLVFAALRREQIGLKLHVVKRRGDRHAPRGQLRHQPLGAKENQTA